ncbi:alpha/beta hydrolase [Aquabacter cavernae]|uniref:alpha/beta hydrolase n=1 Tax=Aquabacter cavernae TaxID=2496029 RepID=UPI0013DE9087|nr:alpha/beta fold hydrolase [Aquabacter cavernae]
MTTRRAILAAGACALLLTASKRLGAAPLYAVEEAPWAAGGLSGSLTQARNGPRSGPAVLLIAGSGPTDRNGNSPAIATDMYRQIAFGLAGAGYRVLRYDKRGVGGSSNLVQREEDLRFDQYVDDAAVALASLRARSDTSAVFLAGHSEGSTVAIRAATRAPVDGLVLLAGPGRRLDTILSEQFQAMNLPEPVLRRALSILSVVARGGRVPEVPKALHMAFRPSVQPFLASECAVDPAGELARLTTPTLLVQGTRDLQVGAADLDALRRGRPDADVVQLSGANHVFKFAPTERAGNFALYRDPAAPLHPGVLPALVRFIEAQG